jgi:hypothetical protein
MGTAKIKVPGESASRPIQIEFKWIGRDEIKNLFEDLSTRTDMDIVKDIVVGWKGVDAPFSIENLELLLNSYPSAALAIFEAFNKEMVEAKVKN